MEYDGIPEYPNSFCIKTEVSGIVCFGTPDALIIKSGGNFTLLIMGSVSLGFALFNVVGGFLVTDRMLAMFRRKPSRNKENRP